MYLSTPPKEKKGRLGLSQVNVLDLFGSSISQEMFQDTLRLLLNSVQAGEHLVGNKGHVNWTVAVMLMQYWCPEYSFGVAGLGPVPRFWVHGSGQVYQGFDGSRSRPPDMDSGKLAFMSSALSPALRKRQRSFLPDLRMGKIYRLAPEMSLFRGMLTSLKALLELPSVWDTVLPLVRTIRMAMCHTRAYVERSTNTVVVTVEQHDSFYLLPTYFWTTLFLLIYIYIYIYTKLIK